MDCGLWIVDYDAVRCSDVCFLRFPPFFLIYFSGHFSPRRSYLKMDLKVIFFTFFKLYVFGKPKACALRICYSF